LSEATTDNLFIEILMDHYGLDYSEKLRFGEKDFHPVIVVDKREHKSKIAEKLKLLGAVVIIETLDTGDYLCSGDCAVERKRGDDFRSSVFHGSDSSNVFEPLLRLSDSVEKPMLILENFEKMFGHTGQEEKSSSLYGALVSISIKMGIPIIPTRNSDDTATVLFRIAKRQQQNQQDRGISRKIPKTLTLKERQAYVLEGFYKIGTVKAKTLINEFHSPLSFITELMKTEVIFTCNGKPKGISGKLAKMKGFGWKFVRENKRLLSDEDNVKGNTTFSTPSNKYKPLFAEDIFK